MFEEELQLFIEQSSGLRAYWGVAPDNTKYPIITLNIFSGTIDYTQDGMDNENFIDVQVDIWAEKPSISANARKAILDGIKTRSATAHVGAIFVTRLRSDVDTSTNTKLHLCSLDLSAFSKIT